MPAIIIRNLSHKTHRALKLRAAKRGRSAEEMRLILDDAVRPADRIKLGGALAEMSRKTGLNNADVEAIEQTHDGNPLQPSRFGEALGSFSEWNGRPDRKAYGDL
jgi:plasmid stability protein